jgi:hypothetical protein
MPRQPGRDQPSAAEPTDIDEGPARTVFHCSEEIITLDWGHVVVLP